jgi:phage terminase small subunit
MKIPKPPAGLQASGRKFWTKVLTEYDLSESHDLERLRQACSCLDEIAEGEKIIKSEGRFIVDRFKQRREHPAGRTIRDNKILFLRAVRELNLDISQAPEARPPRKY